MPKILIVDDTAENRDVLRGLLESFATLYMAKNGAQAIKLATKRLPDLILLDIMMPEMDGYEVCQILKSDQNTKDIPIVFVTAKGEMEDEQKGLDMGAVDYITKPIKPSILLSRVRTHVELKKNRDALAELSGKLSKYLSPQVYDSIFSGKRDAKIESQRKKLTIFFSDIVSFTETTEKMEAEDLSNLLNSYLEEMAKIAIHYGGTIDKFIGDAIMVFFGDPTTKGDQQDALACVSMGLEMIDRLKEMQDVWRSKGISNPFRIRAGINTGYCTVGNFGSKSKMDYTIIGGQVNVAKRLEEIAETDQIIVSYETWSYVKENIYCIKKRPVAVKGIANPVQTYQVVGPHEHIQKENFSFSIGALIEPAQEISPETLVRDISLGRRMGEPFDAIVIVQEDKPIGLLMSYHMSRTMISQSQRAQFFEQPVARIMDRAPLIVESFTPLADIVEQVLKREPGNFYDNVIVTKEGLLEGTVSIHSILEKQSEMINVDTLT
jgi:adenylate cyclase